VYVNFWAIWCEPCKQELRALKKFVEEHGEESFTIIAANIDNPKSLAKVKAYVRSQSYAFPVILDPNQQFFQFFNGQRLPFGILLDGSGKVVTTRTSYLPGDEKEIGREILELVEP
jgi:thiol-disulfide isomerase/thioredoxin